MSKKILPKATKSSMVKLVRAKGYDVPSICQATFAFRCFLLRLGSIGAEFKTERKILLRNLSGNSAFKSSDQRKSA